MFELVFLGTSASAPSVHRGLSATAVLASDTRFLVDCGEGTQRQVLRSGIGFRRLNNILLTHAHLDHILGLGGLISTFTRWESIEELNIWGGATTIQRVQNLIYGVVLQDQPATPIHLHVIEPGIIYEAKEFVVKAFPVTHRGKGNFGFIFQEKARRPFLVDKAEALGIPSGPERGKLVRGETITLQNGQKVTPDMVLGEETPGTKVVFTGDIGRTDNLKTFVQNADVLVSEGTFLHHEREIAQKYGHITARQAAMLARDTKVNNLLITHVSRRYREHEIIAEARGIFPSAIVVRDLDHYRVNHGKPLEVVASSHYRRSDGQN